MKNKVTLFLILILSISSLTFGREKPKNMILLNKGWLIQSSEKIGGTGAEISSYGFSLKGWYKTDVPSTVMNALVKNGVYKDIFFGRNIEKIPTDQFRKPWWYVTKFKIPADAKGKTVKIEFDGIIYRANIWLNGKQITTSDKTEGTFRRFDFDITDDVIAGKENILAVEVIPTKPGEFNIGFVDWNPKPPDNSMGLWREVRIRFSEDVSVNFPFVKSKIDLKTLKEAELTISAEVQNNSRSDVLGILEGIIGKIKFNKPVELKAGETKIITFTPEEYAQLKIQNPRIWWTHDLGKPELYDLDLNFKINNKISDAIGTTFGIRTVNDYLNEKGHRGYMLNGRKVLIRGGGWVDDLLLNNTTKYVEDQLKYVKFMNMNCIRVEGFWGTSEELYDLCDQYGILVMAGWSCQWEWENLLGKKTDNFGGVTTPEEIKLIAKSWSDQIRWLRNHPSIFMWAYGSDLLPRPDLEKEYQKTLASEDPTRPFIASAKMHTSKVTGRTAVKMYGPYEYVTPIYWWIDTANGGNYGFNTETGPGPQVPPIESVKRMLPADSLWPLNSSWLYHCCRGKFTNLKVYNEAMDNRMGTSNTLEEYCMKAQAVNYEAIRGMFESFVANRYISTGVIQWMLNSAWPKLWWQLYDYYLMPTGAFYGTKKSCEPVHIMYNYKDNSIIISNSSFENINSVKAQIRVLNLDGSVNYSMTVGSSLSVDEHKTIFKLPELSNISKTYFLDLRLFDQKNNLVSSNFYWLSSKPETYDWLKTTWWFTPVKEFADMKDINGLPKVKLISKANYSIGKDVQNIEVKIENPTKSIAFLAELSLLKGKKGESILPIFWDDNYFSLLPGEKRTVKGYYYKTDFKGKPSLKISGFNIEQTIE